MAQEPGTLHILSTHEGDTKFTFDVTDPKEAKQAAVIIEDMLRNGYIIMVNHEVDGKMVTSRVDAFDEETGEYIIKIDRRTKRWKDARAKIDKMKTGKTSKAQTKNRVDAKKGRAVAVAPASGG